MTAVLRDVTALAAVVVAAAALVAGAVALATTRRPRVALPVLLDLLLAAGLLRLTGDPDWPALATAASIVAVRQLLRIGLRAGGARGLVQGHAPSFARGGRTRSFFRRTARCSR
jgi:hypothetical protein